MADNSQNVEQPAITIDAAEYSSDVNLNSTMNLEHLEANCLIPSSPQRVSLSPKVSPRWKSPLSKFTSPIAVLADSKMKRRSVLEIQRYGHSRVASAKNKEKQGVTTLSELIESPSAKANGCHDVEAPPSLIGAKSKGKATRKSVALVQSFAQSRLKSVRGKQSKGMSLTDAINSPSAQQNGTIFFPEGPKVSTSPRAPGRRSILQAQEPASLRIKSAKMKQSQGLPLSEIIRSPSAQLRGLIAEEEEEGEEQ